MTCVYLLEEAFRCPPCSGGSRTGLVQITKRSAGCDPRLRRLLCGKALPFPGVSTFQGSCGGEFAILYRSAACSFHPLNTEFVLERESLHGHPEPRSSGRRTLFIVRKRRGALAPGGSVAGRGAAHRDKTKYRGPSPGRTGLRMTGPSDVPQKGVSR